MADDEFVTRAPHPALRHLVNRYIGYRRSAVPMAVHRGLPSRHVTLIISLADPIRMLRLPDPSRPPGRLRALVGGMHAAPI
ncbi:hypothetical protein SAMN05421810_101184 [Amycolatopsis arida]|uniref:Uncharacterized protein n=1 Tax=Amycolatopsis arida TaxID=587909 RepID=A0A1I5KJI6_9PSEU|nr:hypothetical protein CLV69_102182 [Amycolatopsis arida]SFO85244.1 hypothetical protein SAMN05421810_101184 [Amycolatopsis arida]